MADHTQRVQETTTQAGDTVQRTTQTNSSGGDSGHAQNVLARVVWYVVGLHQILDAKELNNLNYVAVQAIVHN